MKDVTMGYPKSEALGKVMLTKLRYTAAMYDIMPLFPI